MLLADDTGVAGPLLGRDHLIWTVQLVMFAAGYVQVVAWAAVFLVLALAVPAVWAWYLHGRLLAATTDAGQRRVLRLGLVVSAGVGVAILVMGVVAFVLMGYNWLVFAVVWSVGFWHLGLLTCGYLRARRHARRPGVTGSR